MPQKITKIVKRTKTYSGCWTCRSRGVKCSEEKPACARCTRSKRTCEGYGIRLVWIGQDQEPDKVVERRLIRSDDQNNPVYSEEHIETAIEDLDAFGGQNDLQIQPFSVFACSGIEQGAQSDDELIDVNFSADFPLPSADSASESDENVGEIINRSDNDTGNPDSLKAKLFPLLQSFLTKATMDERKLFHHWITSMSEMMVAIPRSDNPYKILYIPFALESANSSGSFSGNSALLHGIYAMSASHLAQLNDDEDLSAIAQRYQQVSLRYLRISMDELQRCKDDEQLHQQREVILAVMLLLSTYDIINGTSFTWRIHLHEGKRYLKSIFSQSSMTKSASTLYQMFLCLDMIGSEIRVHDYSQENSYISDALDNIMTVDGDYCLDRMFGITKPIAEAILSINRLITRSHQPTKEELVALKSQLLLANPSVDIVDDEDLQKAEMLRHHRCAFYFATVIHYERSLCKTPSSRVQHLVENAIYHLQTINAIEADLNVSGLFWPVFVTACEADEKSFRETAAELLSKGDRCGIGNIKKSFQVAQEVWARRDQGESEAKASRLVVMKELGLDLLLA